MLPAVEPVLALGPRLGALGAALRRARYGVEIVARAEAVAPRQLDAVRLPLARRFLARRGGPDALLARLFSYADAVPAADVAALLGADLAEALLAAGVLAPGGDGRVEARFRVTPLDPVHVLHDPFGAGPDLAMGPGATTASLAALVRPGAGRVLDLGCGAGSLALFAAARGASRAVGVDLNGRAVALARASALLSGVEAEFREGDLGAPVRGERFDLVVAQPPYVPLPEGEARVTYLHGGARGDELALAFLGAVPPLLAPGGRALVAFDAVDAGGPPLVQRVREALGGAAVDLALLVGRGPGLDLQAVAYAASEHPALDAGYAAAAVAQRDHLDALGARRVSRALAVLSPAAGGGPGATVAVEARDLDGLDPARLTAWLAGLALAGGAEADLLAARVRPAAGARLREERPLGGAGGAPTFALRFEPPGLAPDRELSEAGAVLVEVLAEADDLARAVALFAERCGEAPDDVRRTVLDFAREGLGRGILERG